MMEQHDFNEQWQLQNLLKTLDIIEASSQLQTKIGSNHHLASSVDVKMLEKAGSK